MRALERKGHALGRVVEIGQRGVEAGDAAHIGVLLARVGSEQEELRRAEIIVRAQIGVARGDRPPVLPGSDRDRLDPLAGGLPFAVPAFAVADLDALGDAMTFVKIGAAHLGDVHDARGEVIRPAVIAGEIAEHGHGSGLSGSSLRGAKRRSNPVLHALWIASSLRSSR